MTEVPDKEWCGRQEYDGIPLTDLSISHLLDILEQEWHRYDQDMRLCARAVIVQRSGRTKMGERGWGCGKE